MEKRAQRIPSWPGVIHSNKGRIHLRRPTCGVFKFRLRRGGGPYIVLCDCSVNGEESAAHSILARSDPLQQRPYTFAQTNLWRPQISLAVRRRTIHSDYPTSLISPCQEGKSSLRAPFVGHAS